MPIVPLLSNPDVDRGVSGRREELWEGGTVFALRNSWRFSFWNFTFLLPFFSSNLAKILAKRNDVLLQVCVFCLRNFLNNS